MAIELGYKPTTGELGNSHGYLCPKCRKGTGLKIAARVWAVLLPDGTDNSDSDTEWEGSSDVICDCEWGGKVSDLITVEIE